LLYKFYFVSLFGNMAAFTEDRVNRGYDSGMARPTSTAPEPFGSLLSRLRKDKGLTQMQLAEKLQTSQQMVDYYERRASNPTAKTIQKIATALEVPISALTIPEASTGRKKPGPASKLEELTSRLSELPRSKQRVVTEMLEAFLDNNGA
jgi:transcriptional regulator with XRE-family HTH domain